MRRGSDDVSLPQSKKTRALLAFLAVTQRPQRRERLCEMFWEIPDDPRGALRWSLSKIRQIVGDSLNADRNTVSFRPDSIALDYLTLTTILSADWTTHSLPELERAAGLFRGNFLDDLSLPRCPEFEAWRTAHANEIELAHLRLRRVLIDRLRETPERALVHAHALAALNPEDKEIAAQAQLLAEQARRQTLSHAAKRLPGSPDETGTAPSSADARAATQEIRYCATRSGVRIAYAECGSGPPVVRTANWMSHLEYEWESPIWRHWIRELSAQNRLIRYDERGNGLSDRHVEDISFNAMLADLEDVIDAVGLERFHLIGLSQGCAIASAYAVRHPERLASLILYGGFVRGWRIGNDPKLTAHYDAMGALIERGWGLNNPAFRQMFTSLFIPGATQEQMDWFNDLQRRTVTPKDASRLYDAFGDFDVKALLAQVVTPTLVLHARHDTLIPLEHGRAFATGIPGARFVSLESANHILLAHESAFSQLISEVRRFMESHPIA